MDRWPRVLALTVFSVASLLVVPILLDTPLSPPVTASFQNSVAQQDLEALTARVAELERTVDDLSRRLAAVEEALELGPAPLVVPTQTPLPTAVPVPRANGNANLRAGPGTDYAIVGSVQTGQALDLRARNEAGDWYQLASGVWIWASLVDNAPNNLPPATAAPAQPAPTATPASPQSIQPAPTATPLPTQPPAPRANCDPSYPTVCIPPYPPDLDCGDIPHRRFQVIGSDPHGFDGDNDGIGCESN